MARKSRSIPEINAGSMADIAFLLLVFFLVTTTMDSDAGLQVKLPPWPDPNNPPPTSTQNNRNVLEVLINSNNQLLVEKKIMKVEELNEMTKRFLTNEGRDPGLSLSPEDAIISLKNDRGTGYETYVAVYNEMIRAYNEVRDDAARAKYGRPLSKLTNKEMGVIKDKYPMKISEAEPVGAGE
ncbi:MAG: biopolymer transporter ExbD [Bacteroidia bacterium]|nr:biopolymer transporter ExbD [Bacteroidia bacterium]